MSDQSQPLPPPHFIDDSVVPVRVLTPATMLPNLVAIRPAERTSSFWASLDKPMLIIAGILIAFGIMMVYSTTFDWSDSEFGDPTLKVMEHVRNVVIGLAAATAVILLGYRRMRRFAIPILLVAIAFLLAVQLFGGETFGAQRSLIGGRFQPGEFAELAMVIYMAAWMGSKNARIRSLTYGLIPFAMIVGFVGGLVVLQPDLSTAITIVLVCGAMFFLAGADLAQLAALGAIAFGGGVLLVMGGQLFGQEFIYAGGRVDGFIEAFGDITKANYHTKQAFVAFTNGGWTGLGLGGSLQKFTGLPAPHTDSIFAVIGEELGIVGASVVVLLFALFVARGFQIARRATDPFGALLAVGVTLWIVTKALLNIAVMLALVPPTGVTLPFISFGGSSLVTLMVGVGLLLSVQRVTLQRENTPERRNANAAPSVNYSRGNRRSRLPGAGSSGSSGRTLPRD